jgi:putative tryptophan/tyrosine transport system substrate-binding protein
MKMKKIIALCLSLMMIFLVSACGVDDKKSDNADTVTIGIVQIMEHASLNTIRDAIVDELKELGYVDGENCKIDCQQANGEASNVASILQSFEGEGADIIIAITTPCAQAAAPYSEKIPVVFSAVTDPVAAEIVDSLESTGGNITGTSDALDITQILDFALTVTPDIENLGYLYNSGEANSVACLEKVKNYCESKNIVVKEAAVTNTSEVQLACENLCGDVDAIFSPNDNTIAGAMSVVAQVANEAKIPVYVGADSMVKDGGLGTVGIEYTDLGKETARMAVSILKGDKVASEIPVKVFVEDLSIYVNTTTAKEIGVTIPDAILTGNKTITFE